MNILALIPARMGSSRFPGKPLAPILGKPMIGRVYENVASCKIINKTVVATCDEEIYNYITSIGGDVVMTGNHHERASDRCSEALCILEKNLGSTFDIVVMIQGDEPMISPEMILEALAPMLNDSLVQVTNLLGQIGDVGEFENPNCIKVVCDKYLNALYFSRSPIPTRFFYENVPMGKQVCVIPFRRDFLLQYTLMKPTPLEILESIDMLRILENGFKVRMVTTKFTTYAVDTPSDLERVQIEMLKKVSETFNAPQIS